MRGKRSKSQTTRREKKELNRLQEKGRGGGFCQKRGHSFATWEGRLQGGKEGNGAPISVGKRKRGKKVGKEGHCIRGQILKKKRDREKTRVRRQKGETSRKKKMRAMEVFL